VTCICSAALLSSLFTGATCTIVYIHIQALDSEFQMDPRTRNQNRERRANKHCDTVIANKEQITLVGSLKEFSSITFPDVRTVAVDPRALMLA
jgi:hypothetical protein